MSCCCALARRELELAQEVRGEAERRRANLRDAAQIRELRDNKPAMAADVDSLEGLQIERHVERKTVVTGTAPNA